MDGRGRRSSRGGNRRFFSEESWGTFRSVKREGEGKKENSNGELERNIGPIRGKRIILSVSEKVDLYVQTKKGLPRA